jgi:chemotaxis signal transduction protein
VTEQLECKFLTLSLCEELYAIPIANVFEVLEFSRATKLPRSAPYLFAQVVSGEAQLCVH